MRIQLKKLTLILSISGLAACNSGTSGSTPSLNSGTSDTSSKAIAANSKGSIKVMTTGQKAVYAPRDDGELQPGGEIDGQRFVSGTGAEADCIIDKTTGFMWPKNGKLMPRDSWGDSLVAINGINTDKTAANFSLCGHNDWRMPNVNELETLVNYGVKSNADWLESQGFQNIEREKNYYTSTSDNLMYTCPQDSAFGISLEKGNTTKVAKIITGKPYSTHDMTYIQATLPVRTADSNAPYQVPQTGQGRILKPLNPAICGGDYTSPKGSDGDLRIGKVAPTTRFVDPDGSGMCIQDKLTGLTWLADGSDRSKFTLDTYATLKTPAPLLYGISWENAMLTGVKNLNTEKVCGKNNWRMPSVRELRTLANYNVNNNTQWLNSQGFAVSEYRDRASSYSTATSSWNGQNGNPVINPWWVNLAYMEVGGTTQIGTSKVTDYLGALPVSGGVVIKPAAKAKPELTDKAIFITEKGYTKFAGTTAADAICNQEATASGSLINKKAKFKALLLSSNRYPCNSNGVCGVAGASDWPVTPDTKYTTVGNAASISSNENGVFAGTYPAGLILDQFGYRQDKMFWLGVNGVKTDTNGKVSAWSYANLDGIWTPKNVGGLWDRYNNNTAMDWTFPASVSTAGVGDNGYFPDSTYNMQINKNIGMAFDFATFFASGSNSQVSRWIMVSKTFVDQDSRLTYGVQYQTHLICVQQ